MMIHVQRIFFAHLVSHSKNAVLLVISNLSRMFIGQNKKNDN